jgi:class 3 adenylate cyclase
VTRNQTIAEVIGALESARRLMGDEVVDSLVDVLHEKKQMEAQKGGDSRKEVTVLFGDLVGAERLVDLFDVEDTRAVLNSYYERWITVVARFNGAIERYVGDAVMAVFGLHGSSANHARDAVYAAVSIRGALAGFSRILQQTRGIDLRLRMGINTGPVLVESSPEEEAEFRVVGDTVNVAARLESLAPNDGILVGEGTHDAIGESFRFEPLPLGTLKGKAKSIDVYRLMDDGEEHGLRPRASLECTGPRNKRCYHGRPHPNVSTWSAPLLSLKCTARSWGLASPIPRQELHGKSW